VYTFEFGPLKSTSVSFIMDTVLIFIGDLKCLTILVIFLKIVHSKVFFIMLIIVHWYLFLIDRHSYIFHDWCNIFLIHGKSFSDY
jgi:hypothetical protein